MKILINGAKGRMGQLALSTLEADPTFQILASPPRENDLAAFIKQSGVDIVLDFTTAEVVYQNAVSIIQSGAHPVIGTSGLTQDKIAELKTLCEAQKLGGLIVPNFSIGAVLMMQFAEKAAHYLEYAEIIEAHHENKQDAPSGTAISTAERMASVRKNTPLPVETIETIKGARGATVQSIPVHSIRLPGYSAYQNVILGSQGETLQLTHQAINRDCYRAGILLACQKVTGLKELVCGLENLL